MPKVLFVNYWDFASNSATHIFNLGNRLTHRGFECAVAVPRNKSTVETLGRAEFVACEFAELNAGRSPFRDGGGPDLVHAWTPRELVRRQTEALIQRYGCPYIVHLEDNEEVIFQAAWGIPPAEAKAMSVEDLDGMMGETSSHPIRYPRFLAAANGVTAIIDTLFEFVPKGVPVEEIAPGYDTELFFPQEADQALRYRLGIRNDDFVVTYPGNTHSANIAEMRSLYAALGLANRQGRPVKLVRCGQDYGEILGEELQFIRQHVIEVGFQPHLEIPKYLALADFFVQPGRADAWNEYRIPSKLPEFLAMGRPVILPRTNIGRKMRDGVDALVMEEGHNLDIARQIRRLTEDAEMRRRLSIGGRAFAEKELNWENSAARLIKFYQRVLDNQPAASGAKAPAAATAAKPPIAASEAHRHYAGYSVPPLSYATVADYADSIDQMPDLATVNRDIKDVQRPWMFKALLAKVPAGSRVLEIGGGDPWFASRLVELGYRVVIVDPYEGDAAGPADFERICAAYPEIEFVRGHFPQAVPAAWAQSFDAIYSISVLEHVPLDQIDPLFAGIRRFLRHDECPTVHAIDHVHKGAGSGSHLTKLQRIVAAAGQSPRRLGELLDRIDDDPDVYFLSAEAHNMWRGSTPYAEFPMRRVVSIHLCAPAHRVGIRSVDDAFGQNIVPQYGSLREHPSWSLLEPLLLEFFDKDWYRSRYPDLDRDDIDLFDHFVDWGAREERNPRADFDASFYLNRYPDVAGSGELPVMHYLLHGKAAGRASKIFHAQDLGIPRDGQRPRPPMPAKKRVGVLLHAYYPDLLDELTEYTANIEDEKDIFVNLVETTWTPQAWRLVRARFPAAEILISLNRGLDIGGVSQLLSLVDFHRYDLFLILHSKKSPQMMEHQGRGWRRGLLDPLVGSPEIARSRIAGMRADPRIGLTGAKEWRDTGVRADANTQKYRELLELAQISPEARDCEFVAGTMFFVRTEVIKRLAAVVGRLNFTDSDNKDLHRDGQYAHSVERLIGNLVKDEGLGFWWV